MEHTLEEQQSHDVHTYWQVYRLLREGRLVLDDTMIVLWFGATLRTHNTSRRHEGGWGRTRFVAASGSYFV